MKNLHLFLADHVVLSEPVNSSAVEGESATSLASEPAVMELQPETATASADSVAKDERLPTTPTRQVPSARKSCSIVRSRGKHIAY